MLLTIINVVYVLVAIAMIALILMQRGAGAQAGSGFGAGASATVFGSRGAGNFLSKSTKWLAIVFFAMSLGMAYYAVKSSRKAPVQQDLGLMSQVPAAPATPAGKTPATAVPTAPTQAPASAVPTAPATAPAAQQPATQQPSQQQPQQPSQGG
jgi:preprotein translocase subunit SecG